ncbi:MAG TPA: pilin [bacterium]|nr:pilin [bacterium]
MKKLFLTSLLLVCLFAAKPLATQAATCKSIHWSDAAMLSSYLPDALGIETYVKTYNVNTREQCLDTCKSWLDKIVFTPIVPLPAKFIRLIYHCQNFYIEDPKVFNQTLGCCQVTINKGDTDEETLNYPANKHTASGDGTCDDGIDECACFCKSKTDCISHFMLGYQPNASTGKCEPGSAKAPVGPGIVNVGAGVNPLFQFSIPSDPLKYASYNPATVIAKVISVLLSILGTIALLMFIYAGFNWMTAMGNDAKINTAKKIMVWSTAGLVVIFISYIAAGFLLELVGVI